MIASALVAVGSSCLHHRNIRRAHRQAGMTRYRKILPLVIIAGFFYSTGRLGLTLPSLAGWVDRLPAGQEIPICGCQDQSCCCEAPCCSAKPTSSFPTHTAPNCSTVTSSCCGETFAPVPAIWKALCACGPGQQFAQVTICDPHLVVQGFGYLLSFSFNSFNCYQRLFPQSNRTEPLEKVPITLLFI